MGNFGNFTIRVRPLTKQTPPYPPESESRRRDCTANAVVHGGVLDPGVQFIGKSFTLDQLAAKVRSVLDA
jgi:hypothetical protein